MGVGHKHDGAVGEPPSLSLASPFSQEYLSNMSVVHRDLACRNILVDKDKMLKIADFGLSREGEMYISKTTGQVPLRWMSVETIRDRVFTTKSDV